MKIHEYQAKEIFKQFGIPIPRGGVAETPAEAKEIARKIGGGRKMLKAQIHAGGRGKSGGIKGGAKKSSAARRAMSVVGQQDLEQAHLEELLSSRRL